MRIFVALLALALSLAGCRDRPNEKFGEIAPRGQPGPQGPKGDPGATGAAGPQGDAGGISASPPSVTRVMNNQPGNCTFPTPCSPDYAAQNYTSTGQPAIVFVSAGTYCTGASANCTIQLVVDGTPVANCVGSTALLGAGTNSPVVASMACPITMAAGTRSLAIDVANGAGSASDCVANIGAWASMTVEEAAGSPGSEIQHAETTTNAGTVTFDTGYVPTPGHASKIDGAFSVTDRTAHTARSKNIAGMLSNYGGSVAMNGTPIISGGTGDTALSTATITFSIVAGSLNVTFTPPNPYTGTLAWFLDITLTEN